MDDAEEKNRVRKRKNEPSPASPSPASSPTVSSSPRDTGTTTSLTYGYLGTPRSFEFSSRLNKSWWRDHLWNRLSRRELVLLGLIIAVLLFSIALFGYVTVLLKNTVKEVRYSCRSLRCRLLDSMEPPNKTTVDPCDDFYEYLCGDRQERMSYLMEHQGLWKEHVHRSLVAETVPLESRNSRQCVALVHQACAIFSQQLLSDRMKVHEIWNAFNVSLLDWMGDERPFSVLAFELARLSAMHSLCSFFMLTESTDPGYMELQLEACSADQYRFNAHDGESLYVALDTLVRSLRRDLATDGVLEGLQMLTYQLQNLSSPRKRQVVPLSDLVIGGDFPLGKVINKVLAEEGVAGVSKATLLDMSQIGAAFDVFRVAENDTRGLYFAILLINQFLKVLWTRDTSLSLKWQRIEEAYHCTEVATAILPEISSTVYAKLLQIQDGADEMARLFSSARSMTIKFLETLSLSNKSSEHVNRLDTAAFKALIPGFLKEEVIPTEYASQLSGSFIRNYILGSKQENLRMFRRVRAHQQVGESRRLVLAQQHGLLTYDPVIRTFVAASVNMREPFLYAGEFKDFLNYGFAVTTLIEELFTAFFQLYEYGEDEAYPEAMRCYASQLGLSNGTVELGEVCREMKSVQLALKLSMLKRKDMWKELSSEETLAAMRLFFRRHCIRHCVPKWDPKLAYQRRRCHFALMNMYGFFSAHACSDQAKMRSRVKCPSIG